MASKDQLIDEFKAAMGRRDFPAAVHTLVALKNINCDLSLQFHPTNDQFLTTMSQRTSTAFTRSNAQPRLSDPGHLASIQRDSTVSYQSINPNSFPRKAFQSVRTEPPRKQSEQSSQLHRASVQSRESQAAQSPPGSRSVPSQSLRFDSSFGPQAKQGKK